MGKIIGRLVEVGIGKESVRGTAVAPDMKIKNVSITHDVKVNKARSEASFGNIGAKGNLSYVAQKWSEGSLEMELEDQSFGYFLLALLGTLNTSGPSDSAYTHTFTVQNDAQHDSLSLVIKDGDISTRLFKLAMINNFKLEAVPDQLVKASYDFVSKKENDYSGSLPAVTAQNMFLGRHFSFKLASLTSGLAGATAIRPKKFTLEINKNVRPDFNLGTADPTDIYNQGLDISGEIELNFEDEVYKDLMLDGSYKAMRISIAHDALIGATSVPTFTLDLSRVEFDSWEVNRPMDELVSQKIQFRALWDITNGNLINSCVLVNAKSSY